jgi:hypothetical protein
MMTYIRILLVSTVIAAQALTLNAQTLSVTLKSTASYPQLSADFFLLDKDGLPLNPVSKDDLRITEGGTQRTIVSLTCPPTNTPLPVSVVLTFDASLSMEFYGGSRFGTGDNKNVPLPHLILVHTLILIIALIKPGFPKLLMHLC